MRDSGQKLYGKLHHDDGRSLRQLAQELTQRGYELSYRTVGRLLKRLGYSLLERRPGQAEEFPACIPSRASPARRSYAL